LTENLYKVKPKKLELRQKKINPFSPNIKIPDNSKFFEVTNIYSGIIKNLLKCLKMQYSSKLIIAFGCQKNAQIESLICLKLFHAN